MNAIEIDRVTPEATGVKARTEARAGDPPAPGQASDGRRIEAPSPPGGATEPSEAAKPAVYRTVMACASGAPEPPTSEGRS